jgi:hypothetical protein
MRRLFKLTPIAQQALWCKTSGPNLTAIHIPVYFLVDGDAEDGYTLQSVDENLCGFDLITHGHHIRTLYACKRIIEQINATGDSDMRQFFSVGTFAWRNHPMPRKEQSLYKVLRTDTNQRHHGELIGKYVTTPPPYCTVKCV